HARIHGPFCPGSSAGGRQRKSQGRKRPLARRSEAADPVRDYGELADCEEHMAKDLQLVGFRIGKETFGVPIDLVHEIVRVPEITAVPDAPEYVEGVINLRGKIVSVIDLRKRFGEKRIERTRKNRILVAEIERKMVGLIVDAASEVLRVSPSEIEEPPDVLDDAEVKYVTGVGKLKGRLIILVDLEKIMQKGELRRLGEMTVPTMA